MDPTTRCTLLQSSVRASMEYLCRILQRIVDMKFTCFLTEVSQDTPHLCGESVGRHGKQHLSCKNNGDTCSNSSDLHFLKGMFLSDYLYSIDPDSCRQEIRQKSACRSLAIDIQSLHKKGMWVSTLFAHSDCLDGNVKEAWLLWISLGQCIQSFIRISTGVQAPVVAQQSIAEPPGLRVAPWTHDRCCGMDLGKSPGSTLLCIICHACHGFDGIIWDWWMLILVCFDIIPYCTKKNHESHEHSWIMNDIGSIICYVVMLWSPLNL